MINPPQSQEPFSIEENYADVADNLRIVNTNFRFTLYSCPEGVEKMCSPVCRVVMPIPEALAFAAKVLQIITAAVPVQIAGVLQTGSGAKGDGHG